MPVERRNDLNRLLQGMAESLDITDTQYEEAVNRYEAVGKWLNDEKSSIVHYQPEIYPQGSFNFGTMIKPLSDTDEYDIDLVCELKNLRKENVKKKQLKEMIGNRIKENKIYSRMLEEKNRCWTLKYAESTQFHMDILPAIPDLDMIRIIEQIDSRYLEDAINIPDRELNDEKKWKKSNPKGYAEWFKDQMRIQLNEERSLFAMAIKASVDDVPEFKVKTTLQRSIQILKRHRDIMFADDNDDKPISIIITTLTAQSYNNERDLLGALESIINGMPHHIVERDGISWVPNPVNPSENFADKWPEHPQRKENFYKWLGQVKADMIQALKAEDFRDMIENLKPRFGDRIINMAVSKINPEKNIPETLIPPPHITISKPIKPYGGLKLG